MKFNVSELFKAKKDAIRKIPFTLASHAFLIMVFFIFLVIMVGALLFYQHGVWLARKVPEPAGTIVRFNEAAYKAILQEWQGRQQSLGEPLGEKYINPFYSVTP
ncbi:MAG: hypothetical protein A3D44_03755 [Candidatus Staskawiczbacteria bacterium RIFCSPHIGHO2_02_FULL_42_22]|uniref:Uncharacterized protein n=1 Tax=Candidatus Staskawiczbacteria bacterium RIFCSPHIGHO2_02_FULL_42_22 TaxID=1802207 RepID=A0A1G2I3U2_9BACT|nr:MAG: hypothetical protein A3D44_03755 [Candidatus Staskawiczbacteria bacterium RIFCSPHIGHO2_02_FULL_42_22]